jgi:8-oxo-dGTP pyrophosphatase MutT (NUDIX family)
MEFRRVSPDEIDKDVLVPKGSEFNGFEGDLLKLEDEERLEEALPVHDGDAVFPGSWRSEFDNDSVIVLLFDTSGDLFLHRRAESKDWAPGKIDLAGIAGQKRAVFQENGFVAEDPSETAVREISEETGLEDERISEDKLEELGAHFNPETREHQTVFGYVLDASLEELNSNA